MQGWLSYVADTEGLRTKRTITSPGLSLPTFAHSLSQQATAPWLHTSPSPQHAFNNSTGREAAWTREDGECLGQVRPEGTTSRGPSEKATHRTQRKTGHMCITWTVSKDVLDSWFLNTVYQRFSIVAWLAGGLGKFCTCPVHFQILIKFPDLCPQTPATALQVWPLILIQGGHLVQWLRHLLGYPPSLFGEKGVRKSQQ